jgi:hypothetical protein
VHAAGGDEHDVARLDLDAVQEGRDVLAGAQAVLEGLAAHAGAQAGEEMRARLGVEQVPHLRLGLPAQVRGDVRRGVDLHGQRRGAVQELDQERKALAPARGAAAEQPARSGPVHSSWSVRPASGPSRTTLCSPGRSVTSQDSPTHAPSGRSLP